MPKGLENAGWIVAATAGRWKFVKNFCTDIQAFPSSESIVERNRTHQNILRWLMMLYSGPILIIFLLLIMGFPGGEPNIYWLFGALVIGHMICVIILGFYVTSKVKAVEKQFIETNMKIEVIEPVGETFVKWRPGWMRAPDRIENWLVRMAAEGYHLVQVKAGLRFVFEKGEPRKVSYTLDYQWKRPQAYFDMHKSAGWRLKFSTQSWVTKCFLWEFSFDKEDEFAPFTASDKEKKLQVRRVTIMAVLDLVVIATWVILVAVLNYQSYQLDSFTLFKKAVLAVVAILYIFSIIDVIRSLSYSVRMRKI